MDAELGRAFNTMNANLSAAHSALVMQARQRQAILDNLADAVLAFGDDGGVLLANPIGQALLAVAQQPLSEAIGRALASGIIPTSVEITARGQIVELHITPLHDEHGRVAGAVCVGHDISPTVNWTSCERASSPTSHTNCAPR